MRWLVWIYAHWKLFRWHWKQQKQEAHEGYLSTQPYNEAALCKLREQRDMERDGIAVREVE